MKNLKLFLLSLALVSLNALAEVDSSDRFITFECPNFENFLLARFDYNNDGKISIEEVTDI